ncbi:hypothetical protein GCM10023224_00680 [Streptomonospora halophila]|uniref:VWFA domain-containing protein n=1 Tax=Streptomonospora halophila TaxID=427369 RepID=A0ABP9G1S8_9ACTN
MGGDRRKGGQTREAMVSLLGLVSTAIHETVAFVLLILGGGLLELVSDQPIAGLEGHGALLVGASAAVLLVWMLSGLWAWALSGASAGPRETPSSAERAATAGDPDPPTPRRSPEQADARSRHLRRVRRYLVAPALALAVLAAVVVWPSGESCDPPAELVVATTPDGEPAVEAAAAAFAQDRAAGEGGARCRSVRTTVYAVADGQKMRDALLGAWDPGLGPLPHVWIPGSTAEALLVRGALDRRSGEPAAAYPDGPGTGATAGAAPDDDGGRGADTSGPPVAQVTEIEVGEWTRLTPLVLALPGEMAERLTGGDSAAVEMADPYARLREEFGRGGVRVIRTDPRDSIASMLHTAFLYHGRGAITGNGAVADERKAAEVEAELELGAAADSEHDLVCQVARDAGDSVPTAALTTEAAVYETFVTGRWRTACPGEPGASRKVAALYSPELPVLDHPFVRISGVSVTGDGGPARPVAATAEVAGEVDRFAAYLSALRDSPPTAFSASFSNDAVRATPTGVYEGYRDDQGNGRVAARVEDAPETIPNERGEPQVWSDRAAAVASLYTEAQGGSVLVAVDTSTSMDIPHRKFATAREEAAELAGAAGTEDALGLWAFPAGAGPSATGAAEAVPLERGGGDRFAEALEGLAPTKESTPLRDVVADGAERLAAWSQGAESGDAGTGDGGGEPPAPMLVVVTDGVGEPEEGGLGAKALKRRLEGTDVRVRVLAVGDETRRWGRSDPCDVGGIPGLTEHERITCVPADTDKPGEAAVGLLDEARRG